MIVTNMEHYRKEIEAVDYDFTLMNGDICKCKPSICNKCDFNTADSCSQEITKWLMSEYKPELIKTLKAREKHFVEFIENGFLTRDKSGYLYWYEGKPIKDNAWWVGHEYRNIILGNNEDFFPFVKWEDEEPWEVSGLREWKVK